MIGISPCAKQAGRPGHIFPLAMHSGEIMPPPPAREQGMERRLVNFVGTGGPSPCQKPTSWAPVRTFNDCWWALLPGAAAGLCKYCCTMAEAVWSATQQGWSSHVDGQARCAVSGQAGYAALSTTPGHRGPHQQAMGLAMFRGVGGG